jgi:hypothetical protein
MFFDCCHSGTICDLSYNLRYKGLNISKKPLYDVWTEHSKNIKGNVCMFAGCLDYQTSADSSFPKTNNEYDNNVDLQLYVGPDRGYENPLCGSWSLRV